ncbi:MAG TPA: hypothetical protein VF047_06940 [Nitrososphaeraceae archaeon]
MNIEMVLIQLPTGAVIIQVHIHVYKYNKHRKEEAQERRQLSYLQQL